MPNLDAHFSFILLASFFCLSNFEFLRGGTTQEPKFIDKPVQVHQHQQFEIYEYGYGYGNSLLDRTWFDLNVVHSMFCRAVLIEPLCGLLGRYLKVGTKMKIGFIDVNTLLHLHYFANP